AVELWEQAPHLGGALATAAKLRGNHRYRRWIDWQAGRLDRAGVCVRLGTPADVAAVLDHGADTVIIATGATPRRPAIPGAELDHVVVAVDIVEGRVAAGRTIALVVEDDGPAPPTIAHHLAHLGHDVTVVHQTAALAPGVGKYSIGSMLAQLDDVGVVLQPLTVVRGIDGHDLDVSHSHSGRRFRLGPFDTIALACGATPRSALAADLRGRHDDVRVIGDAYAPRRTVFATRQAWATMLELN
ncbi:MAG: NAD(P)/FAD-dependent oxidoreductase, partial [Ilumatobacteraceae bacterium]|nr:NAD(P)/FAD-dependent oxidoreductase [Ilumatobacteraceae bacterium]